MQTSTTLVTFFQSGGVWMVPIALALGVGLAIAIERFVYLNNAREDNRDLWQKLLGLLGQGHYDQAGAMAADSNTAIGRIMSHGLSRLRSARRREDVEMALEESLMETIPELERRTHYLATLANIATLLGLLGTIIGLIQAFTAISGVNPAEKADLLSSSISVAMNTTAFGLMVAIPLLLIHAWLQSVTSEVVDSLEMASVKFLNLMQLREAQDA
jgi:biopolymer transport protein ExbB/TolQ